CGRLRDDGFTDTIRARTGVPPTLMSSARHTTPSRIIVAFGVGLLVLGWALHTLAGLFLPGLDPMSFRLGALLLGASAGAGAFVLARILRPKALEREHQLNHSILASAAHSIISTDPTGLVEAFSNG